MAFYLRNLNYNKQFVWTYELNEDLYKYYVKAQEDRRIGYMNRLKNYWDEIQLQLFLHLKTNEIKLLEFENVKLQ